MNDLLILAITFIVLTVVGCFLIFNSQSKKFTNDLKQLNTRLYEIEYPLRKYQIEFVTSDFVTRRTKVLKSRDSAENLGYLLREKNFQDENGVFYQKINTAKIIEVKE